MAVMSRHKWYILISAFNIALCKRQFRLMSATVAFVQLNCERDFCMVYKDMFDKCYFYASYSFWHQLHNAFMKVMCNQNVTCLLCYKIRI
jgi:hypothetical protein